MHTLQYGTLREGGDEESCLIPLTANMRTGCGNSISGGSLRTNGSFIALSTKQRFKIQVRKPLDSIRSIVAKPVDNFRSLLSARTPRVSNHSTSRPSASTKPGPWHRRQNDHSPHWRRMWGYSRLMDAEEETVPPERFHVMRTSQGPSRALWASSVANGETKTPAMCCRPGELPGFSRVQHDRQIAAAQGSRRPTAIMAAGNINYRRPQTWK
jgi:hypothetical protein